MAATDQVKDALSQFLAGDLPGVFAIKGAWGVGKTYFWHKYIVQEAPAKNCRAYAYVSLFGITSVAELRRAIFTRQNAYGSNRKAWTTHLAKGSSLFLKSVKGTQLGAVNLEGTEVLSDIIENTGLKHFLVCIDDLERKEESLSDSALLGFIASLRDERQCKVVLLYNNDEIEDESKLGKTLTAYREKVIDRELTFRPTVADSYALVFGDTHRLKIDKDPPANPFHPSDKRSLLEIFETAGTANIRVMRKAKDLLDYCQAQMARKYPNLWPSFARQVVKVSCLYYVHGRNVDLATVTDPKAWAHFRVTNREKTEDKAVKKYDVVGDVGYFQMGCDALILEYLRLGFIDWPAQSKLLAAQEKEHAASRLGVKLQVVWNLIWNNFAADQQTFCREMNAFVAKHGKKMNLAEISQAVDILREFEGSGPVVEALLKSRVDGYLMAAGEDAAMQLNYGGIGKCALEMVRARVEARVATKPLAEAVETLTKHRNSFNPTDAKHLQHCTVDDFYEYMKAAREKEFLSKLERLRGRFGDDEAGKVARGRFEQALERLARESKINARRIRFGVKFPIPGITPV